MKRIVAIIVTYNRKNLLLKCIEALLKQTVSLDILVIDNASTDGTEADLKDHTLMESILYYNTGSNLGGAGGFNYGLKRAYELGYDYFWLMDDDCIPYQNALEEFMKTDCSLSGNYGFLSSKVIWTNGELCRMNRQRVSLTKNIEAFDEDLIPVVMASFVSFFIPRKTVLDFGYPIKEFFIWTDDWEYSRRISLKRKSFAVSNSIVEHRTAKNIGSDISKDSLTKIDRYKYLYRNEVYLWRREGVKGFFYEILRLSFHIVKICFKAKDKKLFRIKVVLQSSYNGLSFNPPIEFPER